MALPRPRMLLLPPPVGRRGRHSTRHRQSPAVPFSMWTLTRSFSQSMQERPAIPHFLGRSYRWYYGSITTSYARHTQLEGSEFESI